VEFERKTCLVNAPTAAGSLPLGSVGATVQEVQSALNRRFFRAQNGLRKYTLILPIAYHQLQPGDNVRVTRDGLKAFDGSSVSSMLLEIVKQWSIDLKTGLVRFEVVETWSSKPISPTGKVSSISGAGPYTVTLATNTKYGGEPAPQEEIVKATEEVFEQIPADKRKEMISKFPEGPFKEEMMKCLTKKPQEKESAETEKQKNAALKILQAFRSGNVGRVPADQAMLALTKNRTVTGRGGNKMTLQAKSIGEANRLQEG
jgi:hypothetical protein